MRNSVLSTQTLEELAVLLTGLNPKIFTQLKPNENFPF